jgi:hypothetical protein
MSYNGWKNWATWNTALWMNNDEPTYVAYRNMIGDDEISGDDARRIINVLMPGGTPDMESPDKYADVDWDEIADAMMGK